MNSSRNANTNAPISIGLPVFNGERFLSEALDSLLSQTFTNFELIISDNASTDNTEAICRSYAAKDSRIRYSRNQVNIGVYRNFNRVFSLSNGEYFKWASADDICKPALITRCLDVLDSDPTILLTYAKATIVDENGVALDVEDPGWDLQSYSPFDRAHYVINSCYLVNSFYGLSRSSYLAKTHLFPTYSGGDYALLCELSLLGRFFEIPECLFMRRLHGHSSVKNVNNEEFFPSTDISSLWRRYVDFIRIVISSGLPVQPRLRLLGTILKRMYWDRYSLIGR